MNDARKKVYVNIEILGISLDGNNTYFRPTQEQLWKNATIWATGSKCNYIGSARNQTCGPAIVVQHSISENAISEGLNFNIFTERCPWTPHPW
jgi:hypothetical protein